MKKKKAILKDLNLYSKFKPMGLPKKILTGLVLGVLATNLIVADVSKNVPNNSVDPGFDVDYEETIVDSYVPSEEEFESNCELLKLKLNDEVAVRRNTELLGVNYNDLNLYHNGGYGDYFKDRTKIAENSDGELTHRIVPKDGGPIKVIVEENMKPYFDLVKLVVDEINYIGEKIDDPVKYEAVLDDKSSDGIITFENIRIGFAELSSEFAGQSRLTASRTDEDGHVFANWNDINISENYDSPEDLQKIIFHELTHAVVHQEDRYCYEDDKVEVSTIKNAVYPDNIFTNTSQYGTNLGNTIMSGGSGSIYDFTVSAGDILLRCAKYSPFVEEKANEYINFAEEYNILKTNFLKENEYSKNPDSPYKTYSNSLQGFQQWREDNKDRIEDLLELNRFLCEIQSKDGSTSLTEIMKECSINLESPQLNGWMEIYRNSIKKILEAEEELNNFQSSGDALVDIDKKLELARICGASLYGLSPILAPDTFKNLGDRYGDEIYNLKLDRACLTLEMIDTTEIVSKFKDAMAEKKFSEDFLPSIKANDVDLSSLDFITDSEFYFKQERLFVKELFKYSEGKFEHYSNQDGKTTKRCPLKKVDGVFVFCDDNPYTDELKISAFMQDKEGNLVFVTIDDKDELDIYGVNKGIISKEQYETEVQEFEETEGLHK